MRGQCLVDRVQLFLLDHLREYLEGRLWLEGGLQRHPAQHACGGRARFTHHFVPGLVDPPRSQCVSRLSVLQGFALTRK